MEAFKEMYIIRSFLILFLVTAHTSLSFTRRQRLNSTRERRPRRTNVAYKELIVTPISLTRAVERVFHTPENRK
jgi:hypothetical protein